MSRAFSCVFFSSLLALSACNHEVGAPEAPDSATLARGGWRVRPGRPTAKPPQGGDIDPGGGDPGTDPGGGDPGTDPGGGDPGTDPGGGDPGTDPGGGDPGTDPGGGDPGPVTSDCQALAVARATSVGGFTSDRYAWYDDACNLRTAALVDPTRQDPAGKWGGYMREYTYEVNGARRACVGSSSDHPGFGYLVNHINGGSVTSRRNKGNQRAVFAGRHHAIHEFTWAYSISGKPVKFTVQWMFATGRDNPLWAVTFDTSGAGQNAVNADSRGPYGDMQYDGGANADVSGVAWGDRYKFTSLGNGPVKTSTGWDYSQPNTVPYAMSWTNSPDAEMGIVQSQTYLQHDAGGYWNYASWGKKSTGGPMPLDYNWTYQLNQYELPFTPKSKRIAWGMNYGAVGQAQYNVYGDDAKAKGYPYQSYSTFVVLGEHTKKAVAAQVSEIEAVQTTSLTATTGSVRTSGPAGVGRSDTATYAPAGYNPIYATWELDAAANAVDAKLQVAQGTLHDPVLVVHGWQAAAPTTVKINGATRTADAGYYASVDTATHTLWLTLPGAYSGATTVVLR